MVVYISVYDYVVECVVLVQISPIQLQPSPSPFVAIIL